MTILEVLGKSSFISKMFEGYKPYDNLCEIRSTLEVKEVSTKTKEVIGGTEFTPENFELIFLYLCDIISLEFLNDNISDESADIKDVVLQCSEFLMSKEHSKYERQKLSYVFKLCVNSIRKGQFKQLDFKKEIDYWLKAGQYNLTLMLSGYVQVSKPLYDFMRKLGAKFMLFKWDKIEYIDLNFEWQYSDQEYIIVCDLEFARICEKVMSKTYAEEFMIYHKNNAHLLNLPPLTEENVIDQYDDFYNEKKITFSVVAYKRLHKVCENIINHYDFENISFENYSEWQNGVIPKENKRRVVIFEKKDEKLPLHLLTDEKQTTIELCKLFLKSSEEYKNLRNAVEKYTTILFVVTNLNKEYLLVYDGNEIKEVSPTVYYKDYFDATLFWKSWERIAKQKGYIRTSDGKITLDRDISYYFPNISNDEKYYASKFLEEQFQAAIERTRRKSKSDMTLDRKVYKARIEEAKRKMEELNNPQQTPQASPNDGGEGGQGSEGGNGHGEHSDAPDW